jgi:hypothetical protein
LQFTVFAKIIRLFKEGEIMVRKVQNEVRYAAESVETTHSLGDGSVVPADTAQAWVNAIRETGDYPGVSMAGGFQFQGLQETVTGRIDATVPSCDNSSYEGCTLNTEVEGIYTGDASAAQVVLRCAARELFLTAQEAKVSEDVCVAHHQAAAEKIAARIVTPTSNFFAAKEALQAAQAVYETAERSL